jgi:hypothetical protein
MKLSAMLLAAIALVSLGGCTLFTDDLYKAQAGYYGGSDHVDEAIRDEFVARFGEGRVKRADVEWKYDHWTAISNQLAVGPDKYRLRVSAYPQLDQDGHYSPIVVARKEIYTGYSSGRGGPTAMYSNMWTEAGRDVKLEAELTNAIIARMDAPAATPAEKPKSSTGGGN